MNAKETLTEWLADGDLERVVAGLRIVCKRWGDKDLANDINFQSGRYKNLNSNHLKGLISHSDYSIELAKIRQSLHAIVDNLAAHWTADGLETIPPAQSERMTGSRPLTTSREPTFWKKMGYVAMVAGILGGLAEFCNFINVFPNNGGGSMQLTVYVQDTEGKPVAELQNKGRIIADFGNDRRAPLIGENGRTNLGDIPEKFRGEQIPIILEAEGFEIAEPARQYLMDGEPVYLNVQRDHTLGLIQGIVKDRSGEHFIAGALVMIDQDTTVTTDNLGRFRLVLPPSRQRETYSLTVKKEGFKVKNEYYKPKSGAIEIRLEK